MKKGISVWALRLLTTVLLSIAILVGLVLSPGLLYANETRINNYTIYHNSPLVPDLQTRLTQVTAILSESEIYDPEFKIKLCLNDGSYYPKIMELLRGPAFGWGFHNIAVFSGQADYSANLVDIHGYKWNMEQLFVHEITHCLQQHMFGNWSFWKANPFAGYDTWKWEGYPEYVARSIQYADLQDNIERIIAAEEDDSEAWSLNLPDQSMSPQSYYNYWMLVQYCLDVKKMSYPQLLDFEVSEEEIYQEMMVWYSNQDD